MPTPAEWLEAEKRGLLDDKGKAILAEARKRGLMPVQAPAPVRGPQVPATNFDAQGDFDANDPANSERLAAVQREAQAATVARKADEKRIENRGLGERAYDATMFGLSMIPRTLTKGEYGLGDTVGLMSEAAGKSVAKSESDFAQANKPMLDTMAMIGEVGAGIPAANTLGAPLRGMNTTARFAAASPRGAISGALRGMGETLQGISRTPGAVAGSERGLLMPTAVGRLGRNMSTRADAMQPPQPRQSQAPAVNQTPIPENIHTIPEKLRDIEAFRELELQPFGPAMASRPTARVGRTIEEFPIVGGTVSNAKAKVELGLAKTQDDIAAQLGGAGGEEAVGGTVQRGLERYRTAGLDELDPSAVRGNPVGPMGPQRAPGIEPYQPVKASETMSGPAATRQNVNTAEGRGIADARAAGGGGMATTARGKEVPNARPLNQIGNRRTTVEDLSDREVNRLIRQPSQDTSFATRAEALYESATRKIPALKRKDGSANPNEIPTVNLGNAVRATMGEVGSQIAGQSTIRNALADSLVDGRSNFTFPKLKAIRTEIGRALGSFGQFDIGLDRSQLKRLYAAASQDMELGLRDLANRAWRDHREGPTIGHNGGPPLDGGKPNLRYIDAQVARDADKALYEFRRADRYFRQGMERMDRVMKVLEANTPNEAVRKITQALKDKTANPQMLREIQRTLRPEELNTLRGHIIQSLGKGRGGAKDAETIFNVNHWATDWHNMMTSPSARAFMTEGLGKDVIRKLDNMARVVNRMKLYEGTKNHSASAYTAITLTSLMSPSALGTAAAMFGSAALVGKLMTSRAYLNWQEGFLKAQLKAGNTLKGNAQIMAQQAKRLVALGKANAKRDPELGRAMTAMGLAIEQTQEGAALPPPQQRQKP